MKKSYKVVMLVVCLLITIVACSGGIRTMRINAGLERMPVLPTLGLDNAVADILWISVIQKCGSIQAKMTPEAAEEIYAMFEKITTLDPYFIDPYEIGGLLLSTEASDRGRLLLEKGMKYAPSSNWKIPFYAAVIAYREKDYAATIEYLKRAVKSTEHPDFLERFLARANMDAGNPETAFKMWLAIYGSTDTPYAKEISYRNLTRMAKDMAKSSDKLLKAQAKALLE